MSRRRLANAAGEEFFEDVPTLTFEDFKTERPIETQPKARNPF